MYCFNENTEKDDPNGERLPALDVYKEIDRKRKQIGIREWRCKPTEMKYCFRERGSVPPKAECLKIRYDYKC